MVGPTNRKNWLTSDGDPVLETYSGSLFHFPHHRGIGDFRRYSSISQIVTILFFMILRKMTDSNKRVNSTTFWEWSADIQIRINLVIQKSRFETWIIFAWDFCLVVSTLWAQSSFVCVQDYCTTESADFVEIWCYVWAYQSDELVNLWCWSSPRYGSLFYFPNHCRIWDYGRFISISHLRQLAKWLTPTSNESTTFWERSGRRLDQNPD